MTLVKNFTDGNFLKLNVLKCKIVSFSQRCDDGGAPLTSAAEPSLRSMFIPEFWGNIMCITSLSTMEQEFVAKTSPSISEDSLL